MDLEADIKEIEDILEDDLFGLKLDLDGHVQALKEEVKKLGDLDAKAPDKFERIDGRILMKEHFDILDINLLKPYKAKANLFRVEWYDNFIPEGNFSISTIDQLFSDDPYKIPN